MPSRASELRHAPRYGQSGLRLTKVLFENDVVRVVELSWKKGLKIEMHSNHTYFAYGITPLKYKSTSPAGKTQNRSLKKARYVGMRQNLTPSKARGPPEEPSSSSSSKHSWDRTRGEMLYLWHDLHRETQTALPNPFI